MTREELEDGLQAVTNNVLVPNLDLMYGQEAISVYRDTMKKLFESHLEALAENEALKKFKNTVKDNVSVGECPCFNCTKIKQALKELEG